MSDSSPTEWKRITSTRDGVPSYYAYQLPIEKPETDDRQYMIVKLRNGLKATLVHDPNIKQAAASLNVAVGHLSDPADMPSLALLCFRTLHMSTKEYPRENDFTDFLAMNRGEMDAETDASNTKFHFTVTASRLSEALSRFSALFHCPLFLPTCVSRELKAMATENQQLVDASIRVLAVLRQVSKNGHVLRQPKTEDLVAKLKEARREGKIPGAEGERTPTGKEDDILTDAAVVTEVRKRLLAWWENEYCASRMDLCVIGKESLDELAELVATIFSPIRNRGASPSVVNEHPVAQDEVGTIIMAQAGADIPQLQLTFPLEYQGPYWRHKPALLFSLLVEQKGLGSLHSYLENRHWITALRCAPRSVARGIDTLELTVDLTDEGFLNYRSVILTISNYFSFLRSKSPLDAYHQRDCARMMSNGFRFSGKQLSKPHAMFIAETMQRPYPPKLLLAASRSNWEWGDEYETPDGEVIGKGEDEKFHKYLEMARLENARILLSAKEEGFEKLDVNQGGEKVKWEKDMYSGTPFRAEKLDQSLLDEAASASIIAEFSLPGPNAYIPTKFYKDLKGPPSLRPVKTKETPLLTIWQMAANVLKASVVIDIRSPAAMGSLRKNVINMFYAKLIQDSLVGTAYAAFLAGHQYNIVPRPNGLALVFHGYIDKLPLVIEKVMDSVKNLQIDPIKLEETIHLMRAVTLSRMLRPPRALADEFLSYLLTLNEWRFEEIAREVDVPITAAELQEFRNGFVSQSRMLLFIHGNVPDEEILKITEIAENGFVASSQSFAELETTSLSLPPGSSFVRVERVPNPEERHSALTFYLHLGSVSDRHRDATAVILSRLLYISVSDVLGNLSVDPGRDINPRSEVRCELLTLRGKTKEGQTQGIIIGVQSSHLTPAYLEERLEACLQDVKGFLDLLTEADLKEFKRVFKGGWTSHLLMMRSPVEIGEWYDMHLWPEDGGFGFDFGKFSEEELNRVTITDIRSLYTSHVHPSSSTRAKLSVHMCSQKEQNATADQEKGTKGAKYVDDVGVFKDSLL